MPMKSSENLVKGEGMLFIFPDRSFCLLYSRLPITLLYKENSSEFICPVIVVYSIFHILKKSGKIRGFTGYLVTLFILFSFHLPDKIFQYSHIFVISVEGLYISSGCLKQLNVCPFSSIHLCKFSESDGYFLFIASPILV